MGPGNWPQQPGDPNQPGQPNGDVPGGGQQPVDPAAYDQTAMYDPNTTPGAYPQGGGYGGYQDPYQQNPYQQPYQQQNPYQPGQYPQPDPYAQGPAAGQAGWSDAGTGWNPAGGYPPPPNGPAYGAPGYGGPGGQPPKKNTGLIVGAIIVVVALVIGGIVAAVMLTGDDKSDKTASTSTTTTAASQTDESTDTSTDESTTDSPTSATDEFSRQQNSGEDITLTADGKLYAIVVSDAQGVRTINSPSTPWTETFSPGTKTYFAVNPIADPSAGGGTTSCKITQGSKTLASDSGTTARCSVFLQ
jgi:hypothetical protein